ncbi:MAG: N-6 DNA methylase [Candidatus Lokiarchaeota archaeon]|nr:N-6 DNA methylase [Candidatus Lokiarchaeota archaeon]
MEIFQKSVIQKYLQNLDETKVNNAYQKYLKFYGNKARIQNITLLKEENYQEGFLREIFVHVLGYTITPDENYNLTTEFKNLTDAKKADAAILKDGNAIGVIELKSTKTKNLDTIKQQAFNYKNNQPKCRYVITSNFRLLRFYIDNATEFEEFDLFKLTEQDFKKLYLILSKESMFSDIPLTLKQETKFHEEKISDTFYKDYSAFKHKIFNNLVKNNPQYDELLLFKKSQKLLDRILFVFFAEDCGLVPPNAISRIVDQWHQLKDLEAYQPLYDRFKLFFHHLNTGHKYQTYELPPYNGGLFAPDEILDTVKIDDATLEKDSLKLSAFDFNTEIDVNILGHIFEHSLNEIEEITAELQGQPTDKKKTKRKKEGIFYTPKYITQYIVENTIGALCKEKKRELDISEIGIDESHRKADGKISKKGEQLFEKLTEYKQWLLKLKILDPACGSGAFLTQALDFLIEEHKNNDSLINELTNQPLGLFDTDKSILENNLYGVDINEESVEIAKLSLWLRTARKDRKLSMLNDNIKCGNSLIDDPEIAGDKAFNWEKEFPDIMNNGGFDVVIGNPPYVATKQITKENRDYFWGKYSELLVYEMDLYELFYYFSINTLLRKDGYLGFITPNTYFSISSFKNLRQYFIRQLTIIEILDFPYRFFPFKDVNTETAITLLKKVPNICNLIALKTIDKKLLLSNGEINDSILRNLSFIEQKELNDLFNCKIIVNPSIILKKVLAHEDTFKDYLSLHKGWMSVPQKTSINNKFFDKGIFTKKDLCDYPELTSMCNKFLEGKDIHRYFHDDIEKYVNIRDIDRKTKSWHFAPKIILQRIVGQNVNKIFATVDENNYIIFPNANLVNLKNNNFDLYIFLGILNSRLISYYYNLFMGESNTNLTKEAFEQIPIPKLISSKHESLSKQVKAILNNNKRKQDLLNKFLSNLKINFKLKKITNKIITFYKADYKEFIYELKKQNIKINPQLQDEWYDYYYEYQKKLTEIETIITDSDRLIDQMVYELYGLTQDEIDIVEKTT